MSIHEARMCLQEVDKYTATSDIGKRMLVKAEIYASLARAEAEEKKAKALEKIADALYDKKETP